MSVSAISECDTLVYLSLGSGPHLAEIRFSVLSAARYLDAGSSWRIVIYTDEPLSFSGLPVEIRFVDANTVASWKGLHGYAFRFKIGALEGSLQLGAARSVIIDGDTYFRQSPDALFRRIAPGASVMHLREGPPAPPERAAIRHVVAQHVPIDLDGRPWGLTEDTTMWNSGVVGLHRRDVGLCERTLHLTDQLTAHDFHHHSHAAEQLAFGMCLERYTTVVESLDVVVHYWPVELRQPFRDRLTGVDWDRQLATYVSLWPHRPRFSVIDAVKFRIKRAGRRMGVELTRGSSLGLICLTVLMAAVARLVVHSK